MKKCIALVALAFSAIFSAWAINEEEADKIRNNPDYIYGEGFGATYNVADREALSNLISKISVNVVSDFSNEMIEMVNGDDVTSESSARMIINTYSRGSLTNTSSLTLQNTPEVIVMRYISRAELAKVFDKRREKARLTLNSAYKAEQNLKIGDALRYYYYSLLLVKSLQYPGDETYTDPDGETHNVMMWIPEKIDEILADINVSVADYQDNSATLFFTKGGKPVANLDFSFFNGVGWTPLNEAKHGQARIELRPGVDINSLRIAYEYEYADQTQIDPEFQAVSGVFRTPHFKHAETTLCNTNAKSLKDAVSKTAQKELAVAVKESKTNTIEEVDTRKDYDKVMQTLVKSMQKNDFASAKPLFTEQGWLMMDSLLHFGKAKMLGKHELGYYELGDGRVVARSLTMSFSFPNNNRTFTEDVTFTFDKDRMIDAVSFGLGHTANTDIFSRAISFEGEKIWSDKSVLAIVTFLENYKTAFALKKLDYLRGVFDDDAVIITGSVIKKPQRISNDGNTYLNNDIVKYNHYTKEQYLSKLERTFNSQEFVNLRFTDNDVTKMGVGGELYSIQIHQDYFSSTYGDTGYLFLIVDINDPDRPLIKVRTWQPERDPSINGNFPVTHPDYGLIGPGNF